jgi:mono/diheme cytochrome c family protein
MRAEDPMACPRSALAVAATLLAACTSPTTETAPDEIVVPRLWDARALEGWSLPLANGLAPIHVPPEVYYAAPVDNLRTYPVYHPDREPPGYREALLARGPLPLIEPETLHTRADWIEAGKRVFEELDTPASRCDDPEVLAYFTDAKAIDAHRDASHDAMTKDGILLDYRWVVDSDRKLKLSFTSCAGCHTRILPDGSLLPGAPSNFDLSDAPAVERMLNQLRLVPGKSSGQELYAQHGVPWLADDEHARLRDMPDERLSTFLAQDDGAPPGTMFARFNGSPLYATRMADLRGVEDRKYLDTTATHRNRGPADIARYGILVEYAESGVFGPHHMLPPELKPQVRPPDEAMYALALYVESLGPARSPYPFDEQARRGQALFESEGCVKCHTPPRYTNNKLVPVPGFEPPPRDDVSERRVNTDPGLALRTRKGTGFYKIPSLRGLWYRGLYEHNGSVSSLEDWFDPRRLKDDYVPSGWRGPGVERRAVPGHEFGLDLAPKDKAALIAFLRTL